MKDTNQIKDMVSKMSIQTTYSIERETAITIITTHLARLSNADLEEILELCDESGLRNFFVYHSLPDPEANFVINNPNEF